MTKKTTPAYTRKKPPVCLCVHGHFYQPPRENPWSEQIETQDSAHPNHDWNEKINDQCYKPNSVSRVLDPSGRIAQIVNNYEYLSFNIGPTLMHWIATKDPHTYQRIVEADKISVQRNHGHGNAIAQVYNHMIMPLANKQDKITQIKWGVTDFVYRFGRQPEGIWLAETAINKETVQCLIEEGIKFTILAPTQAAKVRPFTSQTWQDVSNSNIDPKKPYRIYMRDKNNKIQPNKYLDVFFYDGPISQGVAFEHLLKSAGTFADRLKSAVDPHRNGPQLVHIGTDGESYGHHEPFGDMCLAYFFNNEINRMGVEVVNYGNYLELYPPTDEVELKNWSGEGTAWSCSHGVGRWVRDCGCNTGARSNWNQKWRGPLRQAMDYLRDHAITITEQQTQPLLKNCWDARNDYITVLLERTEDNINNFFTQHHKKKLTHEEKVTVLKLMEAQRNAMLMYTSCAWFFADISGIETVQVIKYAARLIQLLQEFTSTDLEKGFLSRLKEAQSNLGKGYHGDDIYLNWVKPFIMTPQKIVNQFGINYLILKKFPEKEICLHTIRVLQKHYMPATDLDGTEGYGVVFLHTETSDQLTGQVDQFFAYTVEVAFNDFRSYLKKIKNENEFEKLKEKILALLKTHKTVIPAELDTLCEHCRYSLKDIYIEESQEMLQNILTQRTGIIKESFINFYHQNLDLIGSAVTLGINIPIQLKFVAEQSLEIMLITELENHANNYELSDYEVAFDLWDIAKKFKLEISDDKIRKILGKALIKTMLALQKKYAPKLAADVRNLYKIADHFEFNIESMTGQNIMFEILKTLDRRIAALKNKANYSAPAQEINDLLNIAELMNFDVEHYVQMLAPYLE